MIFILEPDPGGPPPITPIEYARTVAVLMKIFGVDRWPHKN